MSTGNWFKAHRKQVITHTLIVGGFLLFLLFLSEPLFDRLDRIPGEAQLQRLQLPAETGGIRYFFDKFTTDGRTAVEVMGWAFIDGMDSEGSEVYIVLKSTERTYIFDTHVVRRPDVTKAFEELDLNLDYSGFKSLIPVREIANGEYAVGLYIRKGDIKALQYTNKAVTKSKGSVELTG